jgi:predicted alpha/beta-hydrolase family hydrolase
MEHEFFHNPSSPNGTAIALTHGAGANCRAPLLIAVADALCAGGMLVLRCDLAFRRRRPFGPPSPATSAEDRAGLRDAVSRLRALVAGPVYLGGHSYGGRQASMLAAEEPGVADGLLLLSYPLHPPEKPQQLRTAHFPSLHTPTLFVHGTKDPFGTPDEVRAAIGTIPAAVHLMEVQGAGHDLKKGNFDLTGLATLIGAKT